MKRIIKAAARPFYRALVRSPGMRHVIAREVAASKQGKIWAAEVATRQWDSSAITLPPEAESLLKSMYASEPQMGTDGQRHALDDSTRISRTEGLFLKQIHQTLRPALSIELGLAYGFSTVYLLSAMKEGDYGQHIAVDPFQTRAWHGIGAHRARELAMEDRFQLIEEDSAIVLPRLASQGRKAQFIFIDGAHKFDDVLADFFLADKICDVGGWIIFDDLWMASIQKVRAFVLSNRADYELCPSPDKNASAFKKIAEDSRDWRHYVDF